MHKLGINEKIAPISADSISNKNQSVPFYTVKKLSQDKVSFSGRTQLINDPHLNQVLLKVGGSVRQILKKVKPNFINGGFENDFYDMKDSAGKPIGYILGIPREIWKGECRAYKYGISTDFLQPVKEFSYTFRKNFQKVPDEYPGFNVGQCVAKCGKVRIHKKIDGVTGGVIYDTKSMAVGRADFVAKSLLTPKHHKQYSDHLARLDKLTQEQKCFDDFAEEIMRLSEKHMFDPNSNNVLVDLKGKRLNIIDPTTQAGAKKSQCHGNHLAGMLGSLFDSKYVLKQSLQSNEGKILEQAVDSNKKLVQIRKKILKRCLIAAKKAGMSFNTNPYKGNSSYKESYDLGYAFKICGLGNKDLQKVKTASTKSLNSFEKTIEQIF